VLDLAVLSRPRWWYANGVDVMRNNRGAQHMTRPSRIRLVALDMAGTTVTDDGVVDDAFTEAVTAMGIDHDSGRAAAAATVHSMMGRSKIEVFQQIFGDTAVAAEANGHFERAYARAVASGRVGALPGVEAFLRALRAQDIRC
jgi:phosphoglycolate phosphatase